MTCALRWFSSCRGRMRYLTLSWLLQLPTEKFWTVYMTTSVKMIAVMYVIQTEMSLITITVVFIVFALIIACSTCSAAPASSPKNKDRSDENKTSGKSSPRVNKRKISGGCNNKCVSLNERKLKKIYSQHVTGEKFVLNNVTNDTRLQYNKSYNCTTGLGCQSTCRWAVHMDIDENRYPEALQVARCIDDKCNWGNGKIGSSIESQTSCKPVEYFVPVIILNGTGCKGTKRRCQLTQRPITVGCTCARHV